jgi:putative ABC transport system permease protein
MPRPLKPPWLPTLILRLLLPERERHEFTDDLLEIYGAMRASGSAAKAVAWYTCRVLESLPALLTGRAYWSMTMVGNYLKTAWRTMRRSKVMTLINVAGLALGFLSCLLILIHVRQETSYDEHLADGERIWRIVMDVRRSTGSREFAAVSAPIGPVLQADYPQVETVTRVLPATGRLVKRGDRMFYEDRFIFADPDFFQIFTATFIQGDMATALQRPDGLVITESMARKYYGHAQPLGEPLTINDAEYQVTGVVADPPLKTHLHYDLVASMNRLKENRLMEAWFTTMFYTYLKLKPGVDPAAFDQRIRTVADGYVKDELVQLNQEFYYSLQRATDIHLLSNLNEELEPPGSTFDVAIILAVGLFILLIAAVNFINLSTARSVKRAAEVRMRRVIGARRPQLVSQFLGESLLLALLSLGLALALLPVVIPAVNARLGTALQMVEVLDPAVLAAIVTGGLVFGLLAGVYPAVALAGTGTLGHPLRAMQSNRGASRFRSLLVVVQFAIAGVMMSGIMIMSQQYWFMKDSRLGFDNRQKLVLLLRGNIDISDNFEQVKREFAHHAGIRGITASGHVPGRPFSSYSAELVGVENIRNQSMNYMYLDPDFLDEFGIGLAAGRGFRKELETDVGHGFLINEAAVRAFGWERPDEAVGQSILTGIDGSVHPVLGVTRDFHYRGLQGEIEPLVMGYVPRSFRYLTLTFQTAQLAGVLDHVRRTWERLFPANPLVHFFLDEDFNRQYQADQRRGWMFGLFAGLGMIIAVLGLLGLAVFAAGNRVKEIGIRRALGASVPRVVGMLSWQLVKWVLAANLVAWPFAWWLMDRWLTRYAYRVDIQPLVFVLSGGLVLTVALLTVIGQAVKSSLANPADVLRHE